MKDHYCRVYRRLSDEYPDVFDEAETLGTYVQLLMAADAEWPARASIPRRVKDEPLGALIECGLIIPEGRDRYSVKGLDEDRERRAEAARYAVNHRYQKDATDRTTSRSTNQAEPSRTEPSRADQNRAETNGEGPPSKRGDSGDTDDSAATSLRRGKHGWERPFEDGG